jgi:hypothetical protein
MDSKHVDPWAGALISVIWLSLLASGFYLATWPMRESSEEARDNRRDRELDAIRADHGWSEQEMRDLAAIRRRRDAREMNPVGSAPLIFVACVGVLAILRGQHLSTRSIIAAIEAVRPAPAAAPAAPKPPPVPGEIPPAARAAARAAAPPVPRPAPQRAAEAGDVDVARVLDQMPGKRKGT